MVTESWLASITFHGQLVTAHGPNKKTEFVLEEYPAGHFPGRIFSCHQANHVIEDVFLSSANPADSYCTCKVCENFGDCSHLEAIRVLAKRGWIPEFQTLRAEELAAVGFPPF